MRNFRFTEKLRENYQVPIYPLLHRYTNSSTINFLHHSGIFVTYTITLHWHTLHTYIHYTDALLSSKAGFKFNIKKTKIMAIQYHHFMANRRGKSRSSDSQAGALDSYPGVWRVLGWGKPRICGVKGGLRRKWGEAEEEEVRPGWGQEEECRWRREQQVQRPQARGK